MVCRIRRSLGDARQECGEGDNIAKDLPREPKETNPKNEAYFMDLSSYISQELGESGRQRISSDGMTWSVRTDGSRR